MKVSLPNIRGFEWDDGNRDKNRIKHGISNGEAEQVFFNQPLLIIDDEKHSIVEHRFAAFGKTDSERTLTIIFTLRDDRIRVISARDMHRKERKFYEENG